MIADYASLSRMDIIPLKRTYEMPPGGIRGRAINHVANDINKQTAVTKQKLINLIIGGEIKQGNINAVKAQQKLLNPDAEILGDMATKTDRQGYDVGAIIYLEQQTPIDIIPRLIHYDVVTNTRKIFIQWKKTEITTSGNKPRRKYAP